MGFDVWSTWLSSHQPRSKLLQWTTIKRLKNFWIEQKRTSPYHAQENGMVERHNRVTAYFISNYCTNNPSSWDQRICYVNFIYNTAVHRKTGQKPSSLVFGQESKDPNYLLLPKALGIEMAHSEFTRWLNLNFRKHIWTPERQLALGKKDRKICIRRMFLAENWSNEIDSGFLHPKHSSFHGTEHTSSVRRLPRLKLLKDKDGPLKMEMGSSHYKKTQSKADNDREMNNEESTQTFPQFVSRRPRGTFHTNGWTKTKISFKTYSLNAWVLQSSRWKQHESGTKHWRARETRSISTFTERHPDATYDANQKAEFNIPSSKTPQA